MDNTSAPTPEETPSDAFGQTPQEIEPATAPVQPTEFNTQIPQQPISSQVPEIIPGAVGSSTGINLNPKPKKKGLLIGGIIAAAVLVLAGGASAAYAFWYQNPDKILIDAVGKAVSAKSIALSGSFTGSSSGDSGVDISLDFDASAAAANGKANATFTVKYQGKTLKIQGNAINTEDGTVYVKASGLKTAVAELLGEYASMYLTGSVGDVIDRIDDTWVKISASDLKDFSEDSAKLQTCSNTLREKLSNDSSYQNELIDLYKKNQFINLGKPLTTEKIDGVSGYKFDVTTDDTKAKEFSKGLKDTKVYKEFKDCDDSVGSDSDSSISSASNDADKAKFTLWISKWSHEITKLEITSDSSDTKAKFSLEPTFNVSVEATAPEKYVSLSELKKDIESIMNSYISADTYSTSYTTTSAFNSYDL